MMKNKIASGLCATGLGIASIGMMGLSSEGQAGFVLAVKIAAVGLAITDIINRYVFFNSPLIINLTYIQTFDYRAVEQEQTWLK